MPEITIEMYLKLCPLLFLAAFIDSAAGGGALISIPAYMLTGFPIHNVYGCNKFSAGMSSLLSSAKYLKDGKIVFLPTICAAIGAGIGSSLGSNLVLLLSNEILNTTLIILLPIAGIFIIVNQIKAPKEFESKEVSRTKTIVLSLIIGLVIGFYDGFFGPGSGTFTIIAFNAVLGLEIIKSAGSARAVNLAANIASIIAYASSGKIIWALAVPGAVFAVTGAYLGTHFAVKKGAKFIRPLMILVVVLLMFKVGYDFFNQ